MFRIKRRLIPALILLLALPAGSPAAWKNPSTHYYLTTEQQQVAFPAPPADGSSADLAELATLHEWEKKRTVEQCACAQAESHAEFDEMFGAINPLPRPLPKKAAKVLKRIRNETDSVIGSLKDRFKRPRPFWRDTSLKPCLGKIGGLAYPSGHATLSKMYALVLSDLAPERRSEFMARADEAALYRVIGGVHHPSDIEAGKRLAETLYSMYQKSPAFLKDLEILRGYVKQPATVK